MNTRSDLVWLFIALCFMGLIKECTKPLPPVEALYILHTKNLGDIKCMAHEYYEPGGTIEYTEALVIRDNNDWVYPNGKAWILLSDVYSVSVLKETPKFYEKRCKYLRYIDKRTK